MASISPPYGSAVAPPIAIRSARLPCSSDPMAASQPRIRAAVLVAMPTSSWSVKIGPWGALALTSRATFSSPSRFLLPEGDQSDPRPMGTPFARIVAMSVVPPYRSRFESGDHTIAAPCCAKTGMSSGCRPTL